MSQFDFGTIDPYVVDGVQLAGMLNQWRDAIHTWHRGPERPDYVVPGMMWVDDAAGAENWIVKVNMSAALDTPLFTYNTTTGAIRMVNGVLGHTQPAADNSDKLATMAAVHAAIDAAITSAVGALLPPGTVVDLIGGAIPIASVPAGWVPSMQGTIGNPASGATIRAHVDCELLFKHCWRGMANTEAPVLPGGRGADENADWLANKTIGGLDLRGVTRATFDSWGGTAAGRLPAFTRMGIIGGAQTHTLTLAELAAHGHGVSDPTHYHTGWVSVWVGNNLANGTNRAVGTGDGVNAGEYATGTAHIAGNGTGIAINGAGSNGAHNNVQPTRSVGTIIKL